MITSIPDRFGKFLAGILGSALGDAMGKVAVVGMDAANLCLDLDLIDTLSYTDDTAMAIGLAETLITHRCLHEQQVGDTFRQIYRREPWRGYRLGLAKVFALVEEQGLSYRQAAARLSSGMGAVDNGAAARITPVALFFADAPDLYEQAALSAAVTHAHPVAIDGAAVLAKAIALGLQQTQATVFQWQPWLQELIAFARTEALREQLQIAAALFARHVTPKVAFAYLGRGNAVQTSFPFALYAFLCHPTSFQRCLLCAVTHGGERDALGAMAGALAGAYLGVEAISKDWQAKLENRGVLEHLACSLAAKAAFPQGEPAYRSMRWLGQWK